MGSLAERVKHYRLQKKLSIRDWRKLQCFSSRGHNIVKLERIAKPLGVPLSTLWGEDNRP